MRDLPTGMAALTTGPVWRPVFLVELDWPSGTVYCWNGYGTIDWNGHTWQGTGHVGKISEFKETTSGQATGIILSMSGIPNALIVDALANDSQGKPGRVWMTSMNRQGAFEADPYQVFDGVIDICPFTQNGQTSTLTVRLEKELIDRRVHNRRRTHEDQQIDYPGDLYFSYVAGIANKTLSWGAISQSGSPSAPGAAAPSSASSGGSSGGLLA